LETYLEGRRRDSCRKMENEVHEMAVHEKEVQHQRRRRRDGGWRSMVAATVDVQQGERRERERERERREPCSMHEMELQEMEVQHHRRRRRTVVGGCGGSLVVVEREELDVVERWRGEEKKGGSRILS